MGTRAFACAAFAFCGSSHFVAGAHEGQQSDEASNEDAEAFVLTVPGTEQPGTPPESFSGEGATLSVRVIDNARGEPTFCRVNVRDAAGRYYEPDEDVLAPWSLQRLGNREGKGPFRYYGWFFYSNGTFDVRVREGEVFIEVWKGFEFRPVVHRATVREGRDDGIELRLTRTIDMAARGWYSGDTHIHLNRRTKEDETRALDLLAAEDIRFGYLLAMNDTTSYTGEMHAQEWPQMRGVGRASVVRRGDYRLSSGQEYRCSTYGHICLLLADDLVFRGESLSPNDWPLFDRVAVQTRALNGFAFHAHGGYEREIYADFVHGNTDGVELLQFAVYRGVGLAGWYHMLNAGYRFPAVGASDFPYCRALGDCRTYARLDQDISVEGWTKAAAEGRSFFTTGPMLLLKVDRAEPGDTLRIGSGQEHVRIQIEVISEAAPVQHVEIIANGVIVHQFDAPDTLPQSLEFEAKIPCSESMWVAARAYGEQLEGFPDAEAHTNPVYVIREGQLIANKDSIRWLIDQVDERLKANAERTFDERGEVLRFFRDTTAILQNRLNEAGAP